MSRSAGVFNAVSRLLRPMALLIVCSSCVEAQQPQAKELLARALHLADLYNWADAAPAFTEAEQLFARCRRSEERALCKTWPHPIKH